MKALAYGAGILLPAMAAIALTTACNGNPRPVPPPFPAYTLVPAPTATPLPTPTLTAPPVVATDLCHESGYCAIFALRSVLLAATWLDDTRMYLADVDGRIRLLDVATGRVETMLEGLSWPRGLTVLDGRLYVSELGNTCELWQELSGKDEPVGCGGNIRNMEFLSRVNARILAYGIDASGALSDRQVVVDHLIASGREHAVNGLANDGEYVYASIGHPQHLPDPQGFFVVNADKLAAYGRRTDLMGVIARFRPPIPDGDGAEVEVYAAGFRNVYGISIAPDGVIYAADNDDAGLRDEGHLEELNAVVEGGFYGFPQYGTNEAPPDDNVIEPVAVLRGVGSTYAYANADGVYVAYRYIDGQDSGFVVDRFDYGVWQPQRVFNSDGYVTAILERQGLLYLVSYSGYVHVINPSAAPVKIRAAGPFHNDDYVNEVIARDLPAMISPGYDVYLDEGRLIYHKTSCTLDDREVRFYLHIFPVNPGDLPEARRQYQFDNWDFSFLLMGWQSGDTCWAVLELPEYPIAKIRTGQYIWLETEGQSLWEAEYDFRR